jgi:hypothetical protein
MLIRAEDLEIPGSLNQDHHHYPDDLPRCFFEAQLLSPWQTAQEDRKLTTARENQDRAHRADTTRTRIEHVPLTSIITSVNEPTTSPHLKFSHITPAH